MILKVETRLIRLKADHRRTLSLATDVAVNACFTLRRLFPDQSAEGWDVLQAFVLQLLPINESFLNFYVLWDCIEKLQTVSKNTQNCKHNSILLKKSSN